MNTSKPIAGISYNTEDFLKGKLKEWVKNQVIEYGMIIRHKKEGDEKKDHWHALLIPAKRLQTMDLETDSQEPDPNNPDKPLKILGLSVSKVSDWVMYCLHDPLYLAEKGLQRVHQYSLEDFWSTDEDRFSLIISELSDCRNTIEKRIITMITSGMDLASILHSGLVPMRYVYATKVMYNEISGTSFCDKPEIVEEVI